MKFKIKMEKEEEAVEGSEDLNPENKAQLKNLLSLLPDTEQKEDLKMIFKIAKLSENGEVVL